ncbi:hypothetical protein HWD03_gp134 [Alteromonas phage vB_AmeM_PT11-V22]|uniref:Uncharacterized protein n=1 Tax=Alteromonas phage vB_AmeM_PT11-V22 TaxID=2704031 RepID=A0A6C0R2S3_9CAUD|nr:hypothetical protein HWD03_gp134 [Alteromonas phage vB_AmeM_PT11-V22]QHZ59864.1 hypothetical protein [Alteromonas phage vB_AmeM_PT11-V22]|tara:strand:- start:69 stop:215 length:147 start_codon:yes stop_codon:yes gene_type:complete
MNKNKARVILNKLRERLMEHMDYDNLTPKEQHIFDEIDEFIMNFEDEL